MTNYEAEELIAYIIEQDVYSLLETYPSLKQIIYDFVLTQKRKQQDDLLGKLCQRVNILEEKVRILYEVDEESRDNVCYVAECPRN